MSNSSPPPSTASDKRHRRRSDYPFLLSYRTRWSDNDQYAHINNAVYYHLFDAIVNTYLVQHCGLEPTTQAGSSPSPPHVAATSADQIGLVVTSFCDFFAPLSFPGVLDLGLRVSHLGRSSVTYEVGVFKSSSGDTASESGSTDLPAAVGGYTHVFVDKHTRTSVVINRQTRAGLEKLITVPSRSTKL